MAFTVVVVTLFAINPAMAHSDQGAMTVEARPSPQPLTVTARARVVFANDGHPANDATVPVTGTGPGGTQVGPTALNRVDAGEYEAAVAVPAAGDWSLEFSSTTPAANGATAYAVAAPEAATPPTTARAGQSRGSNRSSGDDSSGLNASVFAIGGGAVVAAAVVGGVVVARRRS